MEWRHSGTPRPKIFRVQNRLENFSPQFFGIKTASCSLVIFKRVKLSTRSIIHLCWCNWRTFLRKNAAGISPRMCCSCTTMPKLTYLEFRCLDPPPYSPDLTPSDYHLFRGLKNNRITGIFRPTLRSLLPRWRGWNFFRLACESKATGWEVYWPSWGLCWMNSEFGRCSCFLPGRAKNLSAPPRKCSVAHFTHLELFLQ
jgi:hypothetical protein